ncbi:ras association domain-containing protein 8-like isoform X1 [Salarias fasciatus]|uniref:ras association domain-containing protein 8-like isoform X1 n=1 Tax=Salarias fasciatus TaxID=181472 RepID=UPI0011770D64|nr:ras association domain-containing protein 8-like isoform X1 [Salarias fasciatus]XP_029947904.1 ras association domain-containing protein 8-like isoform X1 [Salarias fasciatus]
MELKVWVDGVVRVVSGLSLNTSCQDVVIALAQSIGQTGRYILILKLRGNERHLVAEDCPLQHLAQLGQLAADVQFVLRRTGPSLSASQEAIAASRNNEKHLPLARPAEPETLKRNEPQKAFTFNLGPSTIPKRTKPNTAWSQSSRASPEPRASPVNFLEPHNSSKEEVFRHILQQQRKLQDLEIQLEALEKETEFWEREVSSSATPDLSLTKELDELELRSRENEAELMYSEHWEQDLQEELEREQEMQRRLNQIHSSINDQTYEIRAMQTRSVHLEQDIKTRIQRQISEAASQQDDETLRPLKQELLNRLQFGEELDSALWETQRELQAADERVKGRSETIEELNKELRQCKLQHFIQQTGITPHTDQTNPPPVDNVYIRNSGIME